MGTGNFQLGNEISTGEVTARGMPDRDPVKLAESIGISTRRWAFPEDTVAGVGAQALRGALADAGLQAADLERIILTNSTGGDFLIPATANALADEMGLSDECDCFDVNNACMGFLSSLDLAARCVATGLQPVAVVAVETLSRHISPEEPRSYVVLGDAAAAVILGPGGPDEGVLGSFFRNRGSVRHTVFLAHAGLTGEAERVVFADSNEEITGYALDGLGRCASTVLEQAGLGWDDIDWLVPHQPNGSMLVKIIDMFQVNPDKVVPVVDEVGSVGSASIAVGLDRLLKTHDMKPGARILLAGVGAGMAYGAILYQVTSL